MIRQHTDPILRKIAQHIDDYHVGVGDTVRKMERYAAENSLGIAAPQVGESIRIILVRAHLKAPFRQLINPVVVERSKRTERGLEHCLSCLDERGRYVGVYVRRPVSILVQHAQGKERFGGLLARVIQHEIDHLNGVLILDYQAKAPKEKA